MAIVFDGVSLRKATLSKIRLIFDASMLHIFFENLPRQISPFTPFNELKLSLLPGKTLIILISKIATLEVATE